MVERLLIGEETDEVARQHTFEKIANSLGALGFLIDMLRATSARWHASCLCMAKRWANCGC